MIMKGSVELKTFDFNQSTQLVSIDSTSVQKMVIKPELRKPHSNQNSNFSYMPYQTSNFFKKLFEKLI